jgi:protoheme IX farnesyltransferase
MQSSIHPVTSGSLEPSAPTAQALGDTLKDLLRLTKPRVTWLVMITTACGALVAPGSLDLLRLSLALFGVSLVVGSANAFNMYLERDTDGAMQRTRFRPLPAGRLRPEWALWFAVALAVTGLATLILLINPMSALLSALALVSYVLLYTPLKRVTPWALHVGAVPGALPPLIGWASVTGTLSFAAFTLFLILFVWQLPHFLAIAIFRQGEYEKAGLRVLPAVKGLTAAKLEIIVYLVLLLFVSALPVLAGLAGVRYLAVAALLGALFTGWGVYGLSHRAGPRWARSLFFASMPYLILVFGALVIAAA